MSGTSGAFVCARQDSSYENRLRFKRGKIARLTYPTNPPQALVTPGVQNYESVYMTVRDGKILGTYREITAGGELSLNNTCCTPVNPSGTPVVPPS
jgi:hypothetical protein